MAENDQSGVGRRNILKLTGATIAGLTGIAGVTSADSSDRDGYRADEAKSTREKKTAYSYGKFNNSISSSTIDDIHRIIAQNEPKGRNVAGVMLPDPRARPSPEFRNSQSDTILGYGIKWKDGHPHILIKNGPNPAGLSSSHRDMIENNAYEELRGFVETDMGAKS